MECFRGYPLRRERPTVGARAYELLMPADSNELLDDPRLAARFAQDEYLPYWAALWPVETRRIDWRRPYPELRADRILAADVLYEARSLEPVARFVAVHLAPDGLALLADANRSTADPFPSVAQACGLTVTTTAAQRSGLEPGTVARGRLFKCSSTR
jgi:hypothetical protein